LIVDYGDAWLLDVVPQTRDASHRELVVAAHTGARRVGLDVDVIPADADLTGYELVLAPGLQQVTADRLARIDAALDAGVVVVLGPRALHRDEHAVWIDEAVPPGPIGRRLGARVDLAGTPAAGPGTTARSHRYSSTARCCQPAPGWRAWS
jgi:beta-galactosidase